YGLKSISSTDGSGVTVGDVDANDDPNAESDLAEYRSVNGLPACTTANGCFEKVNEEGVQGDYPPGDMGWGFEISLDLDMVSAICPLCHIILVEATTSGSGDMYPSVGEAVSLGANVVTDSWGSDEYDGETGNDGNFDIPDVPITFSSGDGAYQGGVQYPSASQYVISVGGTMLTPKDNARGWKEKAWAVKPSGGGEPTQGSGSGCSSYEPKPSWQTDPDCSMRMTADVSAVASDVLSYDTYQTGGGGWYYDFGTSISSPIIASVYALADNFSSVTSPVSIPYAHSSSLYDIAKGSTGTCTYAYFCHAEVGYDGPTGLGSPDGDGAF
ncbi:MAG: S8 family serine peptidase, partial [Acidimicrobiales bacterium]